MDNKVLRAYQKAINEIEDITEYREPRPKWLTRILEGLHNEFRNISRANTDSKRKN